MQEKHTLYLIGGLARVGKSTIAKEVLRQKSMTMLQADSIRSAIRYVLMGDASLSPSPDRISFKGTATNSLGQAVSFERGGQSPDDLAWLGIFALIRKYDQKDADVLFEGVAITPQLVAGLKLENLGIKAAFIGYGNESHAASVLAHAEKEKDWIWREMQRDGKGNAYVAEMVRNGIEKSVEIKKQAEALGYQYFDATEAPSFEGHVRSVVDYLLKD